MKKLLRTDYPQDLDNMPKSLVFGELVTLAIETPVESYRGVASRLIVGVQSYRGDLYWDANWVRTAVWMNGKESTSFIYGTRRQGTFIGADEEANVDVAKMYNTNVWRVTVSNDDGKWWFEAERLQPCERHAWEREPDSYGDGGEVLTCSVCGQRGFD